MENKAKICKSLCTTLQMTRKFSALKSLKYVEKDPEINYGAETVVATYVGGGSVFINVEMDSGYAMVCDIMKRL